VNKLRVEKKKKSTDIIIEKSVELFGFTPDEMSDDNQNWMIENGYINKRSKKHWRDLRGKYQKRERY